MARKALILSILTSALTIFVTNFSLASPASASTIINDTEYWSVTELTELKTAVDQEKEELCHGDYNCEEDFRWNLYERGEKYQALDMFNYMIFMATNINPVRETITLRYAPFEEPWMRQLGINQEPEEAGELYLFWLDEGMNDPTIYMQYTNGYVDEIKSGDIEEGLHPVLKRSHFLDGENWLPIGEEVEFSIAGSNLFSSPRARIFDKMISTDPDRTILMGSIEYQECLDSPDYQPGMDCRLMISATHGPLYVPVEYVESTTISVVNDDNLNSSSNFESMGLETSQNTTNSQDTAITHMSETPTEAYLAKSTTNIEEPNSNNNSIATTNLAEVMAPQTGNASLVCSKEIDMPWWLVVMLVTGDALVVWWFLPTNHKKFNKKV